MFHISHNVSQDILSVSQILKRLHTNNSLFTCMYRMPLSMVLIVIVFTIYCSSSIPFAFPTDCARAHTHNSPPLYHPLPHLLCCLLKHILPVPPIFDGLLIISCSCDYSSARACIIFIESFSQVIGSVPGVVLQ
jgi:hypothetical protein